MKYLKVFYDWPETTQYLKPAQKGELIDALVRYARGETGIESSLRGAALTLFPSFKRQIDSDAEAYSSQTERNRENGKKGGRPKKEPKETQKNPENPVGFSETQKSQDKDKDKDKDKDDTTVTTLPSYLKKKIDNNYKYSSKARRAVAQLIVDQFSEEGLPVTRDYPVLYNDVLCALVEGLTPEQIYSAGKQSRNASEFNPILIAMNGYKWRTEDPFEDR